MVLETGERAPSVEARNQDGDRVTLTYEGTTVLYFYPRDDTRGCTIEARQFSEELPSYRDAGVDVYGVSTDDHESHREFTEKYDLDVPLLADPDGEIADAFGVPIEDGAAQRTTFVVVDGQIVAVYEGVRPDGHAREVLRDLAEAGLVTVE
ncbi:MAG: peroxiredoxin [Haloarculaceae archaeon]